MSANSESRMERRVQRLRRVRRRRAIVLAIVAAIAALCVADVRGRMEVGHVDGAQGHDSARLATLQGNLGSDRVRIGAESAKFESIEGTIAQRQTTITLTDNQTAQHNATISVDNIDFTALSTCLTGVTQALDQISVGETLGGIASLQAIAPTCQSAGP